MYIKDKEVVLQIAQRGKRSTLEIKTKAKLISASHCRKKKYEQNNLGKRTFSSSFPGAHKKNLVS